jgi:putative phosphoribosyl transferase
MFSAASPSFRNRTEAGRQLGRHLASRLSGPSVVLGIPRGGVIVALPVAESLDAPLDIIVPRKVGAPGEPELAVGAVALTGGEEIALFDEPSLRRLEIPQDYLQAEVARQKQEIERRLLAYRGDRPATPLAGQTVVIVDDGIATGLTARAAAAAIARQGPRDVVVAAPVAPLESRADFDRAGVHLEVLATPSLFIAVGQFYEDFHAVDDEEVRAALRAGPRVRL